jgi:DNA-binding NtrC family response regulator
MPGARLQDCALQVIDGPDRGLSAPLGLARITIGASPSCDLVLSDPSVSGVHAELAPLDDGVRVRDLGSTNGVTHLGVRIHEALLRPGAVIGLGKTTLALIPPEVGPFAESEACDYAGIVGHSPAMRRLFSALTRLEATELTVLVEGETGTGKSLLARTLHEASRRRDGPLVVLDCGAISPGLLHSELFGHRKGAFTGALRDRAGVLETAHGGTVLLEEIGELPLELQPTLLRFIETGELQRVGETRTRCLDVRVIAATNLPLDRALAEGRFRLDLFHRLSVMRLHIPPLRERPEDILPLARRFLAQQNAHAPGGACVEPAERRSEAGRDAPPPERGARHQNAGGASLTPAVAAMLQSYPWPGNARQLHNAITRLASLGRLFVPEEGPDAPDAEADFHQAKARMIARFERGYLEALMHEHAGNLSAASRASGLVRHHLRKLLARHGVDPGRFRS